MLQCVAVCCSALQCAVVCCSVLQCVAVCSGVMQCGVVWRDEQSVHASISRAASKNTRRELRMLLSLDSEWYTRYGVASISRLLEY